MNFVKNTIYNAYSYSESDSCPLLFIKFLGKNFYYFKKNDCEFYFVKNTEYIFSSLDGNDVTRLEYYGEEEEEKKKDNNNNYYYVFTLCTAGTSPTWRDTKGGTRRRKRRRRKKTSRLSLKYVPTIQ